MSAVKIQKRETLWEGDGSGEADVKLNKNLDVRLEEENTSIKTQSSNCICRPPYQ